MSKEGNEQTAPHDDDSSPETEWPSVPFAYDFVIPSYQWVLTRFEAVDSRIQTLQAFIATTTLGVPAIATTMFKTIKFTSCWFLGAIGLAGVAIIIGLIGRSWGRITLANPRVLYEQWLHKPVWEFKKDMLYFAGQHFEKSSDFVNTKSRLVTVMSVLFFLETLLLFVWIAFARS